MSRFGDVPEAPKDPILGFSEMFNGGRARGEDESRGGACDDETRDARGTARGPVDARARGSDSRLSVGLTIEGFENAQGAYRDR